MVIRTGKERIEEVDIEVEKGKIGKAEEYSYLGNWINERGNVEKDEENDNGPSEK